MQEPELITIDCSIFSMESVKKTALRYSGHYWVEIAQDNSSAPIMVTLTPKDRVPFDSFITKNFRQDLLDQDLREIVARETQVVTNLILAQAFSHLTPSDNSEQPSDAHPPLNSPQ